MWWWLWVAVVVALIAAYLAWLAARVDRLHRRAATAATALDAALVRRAAAAAVLAELLAPDHPLPAGDLYAAARAALDSAPAEREPAENDLTSALRRLVEHSPTAHPDWSPVTTASRRVALARQVHTDVVRDALALRRRPLVRALRLARRHAAPGYFDIDDPGLDQAGQPPQPVDPAGRP